MSTITAQALAEAVTSDADGEVQWWTRQGSSEPSLTREGRRLVITDTEEGVTLTYWDGADLIDADGPHTLTNQDVTALVEQARSFLGYTQDSSEGAATAGVDDPGARRQAALGYLGPLADDDDDVVNERVRKVLGAWDAVEAAWPDPQDADGLAAASDGAVSYVLGDCTIRAAANEVLRARVAASEAEARLRGIAIAAVDAGMAVSHAAADAGVSRATMHRWIGPR